MNESVNLYEFKRLIVLFNYQYRTDKGEEYFNIPISIVRSKRTGRVRYIYSDNSLIATVKPTNGHLILSLKGAKRFLRVVPKPSSRVIVERSVESIIREGRNVYSKHVRSCDPLIRPADEVLVVDDGDNLLAVGRALLNGDEMTSFKYGVAVNVRKGVGDLNDEAEVES
ncbi:MAG: PUA domain-containing protein [Candidatus Odinarchaeota archaeon]